MGITMKLYKKGRCSWRVSALLALLIALPVSAKQNKPNIWVYSDMTDPRDERANGHPKNDPDDMVSLAALLLSANRYNIVSIVLGSVHFNNVKDTMPFVNEVYRAAYRADIKKLEKHYPGFQKDILFQHSSITKNAVPEKFDSNKNYSDLSKYDTVKQLVDYAKDNAVYVMSWGSLTEPAMAIKHLLDVGDKKTLANITFISHWTKSYLKSALQKDLRQFPYDVSNCSADRSACDYVHEQAAQHKAVKFIELGSIGQTGIVDGSKKYGKIEIFEKSRLGQIFIHAKYYGLKPDQSDASTHWVLSEQFGFTLDDFKTDGRMTAAQELKNKDTFFKLAPSIMDDLSQRAAAVSESGFSPAFLAKFFTYAYHKKNKYHVYSPFIAPYRVYDTDGRQVDSGRLVRGHKTIDLPKKLRDSYRLEIDYADGPVNIQM